VASGTQPGVHHCESDDAALSALWKGMVVSLSLRAGAASELGTSGNLNENSVTAFLSKDWKVVTQYEERLEQPFFRALGISIVERQCCTS
jgi:hypothetical protein